MENNDNVIIISDNKDGHSFNASSLVQNPAIIQPSDPPEPPKKRGPGRPPKNKDANNIYTDIVTGDTLTDKRKQKKYKDELEKAYSPNAKMLVGVIAQAEQIHQNIEEELSHFRERKAYGGTRRSESMSNLMSTQASLLSTKISAIRELNSIRNKINDLDMKHNQITKDANDQNSDKAVIDAYTALLNAPNYGLKPIQPIVSPMSLNTGSNMQGQMLNTFNLSNGIVTESNPNDQNFMDRSNDPQFNNYVENLTPVQKRMILEHNPDIHTVVIYNQSSGTKRFEVMNVKTKQILQGVDKPGDFLLDGIQIDTINAIAKNKDTNEIYPLVIENGYTARDEI